MKEAVVLLVSGDTIVMKKGETFFDHFLSELSADESWVVGEEGAVQIKHVCGVIMREPVS